MSARAATIAHGPRNLPLTHTAVPGVIYDSGRVRCELCAVANPSYSGFVPLGHDVVIGPDVVQVAKPPVYRRRRATVVRKRELPVRW